MKHTEAFVGALTSGDKKGAAEAFRNAMSTKVESALASRSVQLTGEIYNQSRPPIKK